MDLEQVRRELEQGKAVLIDVREQSEWDAVHLRHSRLIPIGTLKDEDVLATLPQNKNIYLHCHRGRRAAEAAELLKAQFPKAQALPYTFEELQARKL